MSIDILQFQIALPITNYTLQSLNLAFWIDKNVPTGHALVITVIGDVPHKWIPSQCTLWSAVSQGGAEKDHGD